MKVFTYSQARQALASVLDTARKEDAIITRRGGDRFVLSFKAAEGSPFDVPGIKSRASTSDIVAAVREVRSRGGGEAEPGT